MVKCLLANEVVVGSNPVSVTYTVKPVYRGHLKISLGNFREKKILQILRVWDNSVKISSC